MAVVYSSLRPLYSRISCEYTKFLAKLVKNESIINNEYPFTIECQQITKEKYCNNNSVFVTSL